MPSPGTTCNTHARAHTRPPDPNGPKRRRVANAARPIRSGRTRVPASPNRECERYCRTHTPCRVPNRTTALRHTCPARHRTRRKRGAFRMLEMPRRVKRPNPTRARRTREENSRRATACFKTAGAPSCAGRAERPPCAALDGRNVTAAAAHTETRTCRAARSGRASVFGFDRYDVGRPFDLASRPQTEVGAARVPNIPKLSVFAALLCCAARIQSSDFDTHVDCEPNTLGSQPQRPLWGRARVRRIEKACAKRDRNLKRAALRPTYTLALTVPRCVVCLGASGAVQVGLRPVQGGCAQRFGACSDGDAVWR